MHSAVSDYTLNYWTLEYAPLKSKWEGEREENNEESNFDRLGSGIINGTWRIRANYYWQSAKSAD